LIKRWLYGFSQLIKRWFYGFSQPITGTIKYAIREVPINMMKMALINHPLPMG
jgi:hypothetical protein